MPCAKFVGDRRYSILTGHPGTPYGAYDAESKKEWSRELEIYGRTRRETGKIGLSRSCYRVNISKNRPIFAIIVADITRLKSGTTFLKPRLGYILVSQIAMTI